MTPRQHVNNKHVKSKTFIPSPEKKEKHAPKPKPKAVKASVRNMWKVKEPELVVPKKRSVVIPDKGQFFKYVGPNQVWAPKVV